jgi:hypothetical protein
MADGKRFWADLFTGAREAGIVPEASADPPANPAPATTTNQGDQRLASENAELRRQLAKAQAERIQADAQAFVKEQLGAGHAYPAEAQALAALYVRMAETDAASPRSDGQPSCIALLEAAAVARPAHQLSQDLISPQQPATVLVNNVGGSEEAEAEARAERVRERNKRTNGRRAS